MRMCCAWVSSTKSCSQQNGGFKCKVFLLWTLQYVRCECPGFLRSSLAVFVSCCYGACYLRDMVEKLPGLFCAIGDCAYTPTEHLVPIFAGPQATNLSSSNYNFNASQCKIRIEMAFGPLTCKLKHVWRVAVCIARLHNF